MRHALAAVERQLLIYVKQGGDAAAFHWRGRIARQCRSMLFLKGNEPIKLQEGAWWCLNWISGLTSDGRLDGPMHNAGEVFKALGDSSGSQPTMKQGLACGQLVIEAIQKLIPGDSLSRNLYSQFLLLRNSPVPPRILRKAQNGLTKLGGGEGRRPAFIYCHEQYQSAL